MKTTKRWLAWLAALSLSACGASSAPKAAPVTPAQPAYASPPPTATGPSPPAASPAPSPGAAEAAPATTDMGKDKAPGQRASVELGAAKRDLSVALGQADCRAACRALASMEKATRQICELASSDEQRDQCRSAEKDLDAAKGRVRAACGVCGTMLR